MPDPACDPTRMHYFKTPVYDGEKCLCGQTTYSNQTDYHHIPDDGDDPKPFNSLTDVITSPWAPLIESVIFGGSDSPSVPEVPDFGGGQSGGGGASGDF